jgi:hypothetical protein
MILVGGYLFLVINQSLRELYGEEAQKCGRNDDLPVVGRIYICFATKTSSSNDKIITRLNYCMLDLNRSFNQSCEL